MRLVLLMAVLTACAASHTVDRADNDPACGPVSLGPHSDPAAAQWVALAGHDELALFVDGADTAVAGRMIDTRSGRAFRPAFPLTPGLRYTVRSAGCTASFAVPVREDRAPPSVVAIYPTSPVVPENILRFYVYFSQPMAEGDFLKHIRLEHVASGTDLTGVFFDNIYELWSADRKRITLLVDPGRVKLGLQANIAQGRAFRAGEEYRLHVRASWKTIDGRALNESFTKTFRAGGEDRVRVDPRTWTLSLPRPGTREALVVDFGEPVDHVSVGHFLRVVSARDEALPGTWQLMPDERRARWTPAQAWTAVVEEHRLVVDRRFEDIAGNNVDAALDHRVGELDSRVDKRAIIRPFR